MTRASVVESKRIQTNEDEHTFTYKVSVDNVNQSSCHPAPEIEDKL